ncbi:MAG: MarC family protein [Holosporales bacterium]|jgi:multiple antibiotic resistance protein|nr:MarC family protein [Holosporales bacterium]
MLESFVPSLVKLFFVINPHIIVPFFFSLTQNYTNSERRSTAAKMSVYSFGLGMVFVFCGNGLIDALGVTLPAFRVCGGLLLAVAGWSLLYSKSDDKEEASAGSSRSDASLCPLAFPMFVGPATLTTIVGMIQSAKEVGGGADLMVICAFCVLVVFVYLLCLYGSNLMRLLGKNGLVLLGKIGGILVMAMALQMILGGTKAFFGEPVVTVVPTQAQAQAEAD